MQRLSRRWFTRIMIGLLVLASMSFAVGALASRSRRAPKAANAIHAAAQTGSGSVDALGEQVTTAEATGFSGVDPGPVTYAPMVEPVQVGGTSGGGSGGTAALSPLGDRVIRTDDITLEVRKGEFGAAWSRAYALVHRFGGYVLTADRTTSPATGTTSSQQIPTSGDITIRIPAGRFEAATEAFRGLGLVRSDAVSSQDVSQEYVDLRSQLRNLRATESALLRLQARANTVGDTLAVQNRLSQVQGDIEQATGRLRYLDARTIYSTVTLHIGEKGAASIASLDNSGKPSLSKAWTTATAGLVRIGGALLIFGVWGGPFLVVAFGLFLVWRRARRDYPEQLELTI